MRNIFILTAKLAEFWYLHRFDVHGKICGVKNTENYDRKLRKTWKIRTGKKFRKLRKLRLGKKTRKKKETSVVGDEKDCDGCDE